jgi:Kelch motif
LSFETAQFLISQIFSILLQIHQILIQHLAKFTSDWETYTPYPLPLSEGHGGIIGTDLVLFSGFTSTYSFVTDKVFALDLSSLNGTSSSSPSALWREMDPFPITKGLTHAGYVVQNDTIYSCGGYIGGPPYPATSRCFRYIHTNPRGSQWSELPALPEVRAGGAMVYDTKRQSLIYATGADRHAGSKETNASVDHNDVWELSLANYNGSWVLKEPIPYVANHVGYTTVKIGLTERHYVMGGQSASNESNGNQDSLYEYNSSSDTWIQRASMPFPRGHFSSSVVPYKHCGFFISAGAMNGDDKTSEVTYYSIQDDTWTQIGNLVFPLNTPICTMFGEYLYCQTGVVNGKFSWRRKIV